MGKLRKFVKERHSTQKKKDEPVLEILEKFKKTNDKWKGRQSDDIWVLINPTDSWSIIH